MQQGSSGLSFFSNSSENSELLRDREWKPSEEDAEDIAVADRAIQTASKYCEDLAADLKSNNYPKFQKDAQALIDMAQSALAKPSAAERIENPMGIVTALIDIIKKNPQLEQADEKVRLPLARALHIYLDLMIIDNSERPEESKLSIREKTKMDFIEVVGHFRQSCAAAAVDLHYELDCCHENLKAMEDKSSVLSDLKIILKAAISADIGSLVELFKKTHDARNQPWFVDVLLIRRLTPLAQRSPQVFHMLQEHMATVRKSKYYQIAYASQEALYQVIVGGMGPEANLLRKQAFGIGLSKQEERSALTMQYFAGTHATKRGAIYETAKHRYRFIHVLKMLCLQLEEKTEFDVSKPALDMLIELSGSVKEPKKEWIRDALRDVIQVFKTRGQETNFIIQSLQKNLEEERSIIEKMKKDLAEQGKAKASENQEKELTQLKAEQKQLALEKNELEYKNNELTERLNEEKSELESAHHEISHLGEQVKLLKSREQRLTQELSDLKNRKNPDLSKINACIVKLKQQQQEILESEKSYQKLQADTQEKAQHLEKLKQKEKEIAEREELLFRKEQELEKQVAALADQTVQIKEQQISLDKQLAENLEFAELLEAQRRGIEKGKPPVSPQPAPAAPIVFGWEFDSKLQEKYERISHELDKLQDLSERCICPVIQTRVIYDAVNIRVKNSIHKAHVVSEAAAREWFKDKHSCPHCGTGEVEHVEQDTFIRNLVQDRLDKLLKLEPISLQSQPPKQVPPSTPTPPLAPLPLPPVPKPFILSNSSSPQGQLITACEQGDFEAVKLAIQKGAQANSPDSTTGKLPLGAAIWGMNPLIVNYLLTLTRLGFPKPMTWEECKAHNQKHYFGTFMTTGTPPRIYDHWYDFLTTIEKSPFIKGIHLDQCNKYTKHFDSWQQLKDFVYNEDGYSLRRNWKRRIAYKAPADMAADFKQLMTQIETAVIQAQQPLPALPPPPPPLPINLSLASNPQRFMPPKMDVKPADSKDVEKLLRLVAEGEQDQAEAMIKQNSKLLLASGKVEDLSGRIFENITAFQYAVWARDYHMWSMIRKYLDLTPQREQFNALETKETEHGKQYDLKPLTEALQMYVDKFDEWNWDERDAHWGKIVGKAQKGLPAHVVNEYCRPDRPLEPCPTDWKSAPPRTLEVEVWEGSRHTYTKGSWFVALSSQSALSATFAFLRYNYGRTARAGGGGVDRIRVDTGRKLVSNKLCVARDLKALTSLWKARTQQLDLLKTELLAVKPSQSRSFGVQ